MLKSLFCRHRWIEDYKNFLYQRDDGEVTDIEWRNTLPITNTYQHCMFCEKKRKIWMFGHAGKIMQKQVVSSPCNASHSVVSHSVVSCNDAIATLLSYAIMLYLCNKIKC